MSGTPAHYQWRQSGGPSLTTSDLNDGAAHVQPPHQVAGHQQMLYQPHQFQQQQVYTSPQQDSAASSAQVPSGLGHPEHGQVRGSYYYHLSYPQPTGYQHIQMYPASSVQHASATLPSTSNWNQQTGFLLPPPSSGPAVLVSADHTSHQQAQGPHTSHIPSKRTFSQVQLDQSDHRASSAAAGGTTQSKRGPAAVSPKSLTIGAEAETSAATADQEKENTAARIETPRREVAHAEQEQEQEVERPAKEQEELQSVAERVRDELMASFTHRQAAMEDKIQARLDYLDAREKQIGEREAVIEARLEAKLEGRIQGKLEAELTARLESQLAAKLETELKARLEAELTARLESQLTAKLETELKARLEAKLESQLTAKLETELRARLEPKLEAKLAVELTATFKAASAALVTPKLRKEFETTLKAQVQGVLKAELEAELKAQLEVELAAELKGQVEAKLNANTARLDAIEREISAMKAKIVKDQHALVTHFGKALQEQIHERQALERRLTEIVAKQRDLQAFTGGQSAAGEANTIDIEILQNRVQDVEKGVRDVCEKLTSVIADVEAHRSFVLAEIDRAQRSPGNLANSEALPPSSSVAEQLEADVAISNLKSDVKELFNMISDAWDMQTHLRDRLERIEACLKGHTGIGTDHAEISNDSSTPAAASTAITPSAAPAATDSSDNTTRTTKHLAPHHPLTDDDERKPDVRLLNDPSFATTQ